MKSRRNTTETRRVGVHSEPCGNVTVCFSSSLLLPPPRKTRPYRRMQMYVDRLHSSPCGLYRFDPRPPSTMMITINSEKTPVKLNFKCFNVNDNDSCRRYCFYCTTVINYDFDDIYCTALQCGVRPETHGII